MPRKVNPDQQKISKAELIQAAEARCWRAYVSWRDEAGLDEYQAAKKALAKLKAK